MLSGLLEVRALSINDTNLAIKQVKFLDNNTDMWSCMVQKKF
jgi:hypothetical protein